MHENGERRKSQQQTQDAHAPVSQSLLLFVHQVADERARDLLDVHEVAVGTAPAGALIELAAPCLTELGDRRVLGHKEVAGVEAALEGRLTLLSLLFVPILEQTNTISRVEKRGDG